MNPSEVTARLAALRALCHESPLAPRRVAQRLEELRALCELAAYLQRRRG